MLVIYLYLFLYYDIIVTFIGIFIRFPIIVKYIGIATGWRFNKLTHFLTGRCWQPGFLP